MVVSLAFSVTLLIALFMSGPAQRSVLSAALVFVIAGLVMGNGMLGLIPTRPEDPPVAMLAEVALCGVLVTDGVRIGAHGVRSAWRIPGRALLFRLPSTPVRTAALPCLGQNR
jgi:NhaP-type Na+/H+ or K+/H+ antiporter